MAFTPMIIVSAPSGAGKSSFCNQALKDFPLLMHSISHTTRPPRSGEVNGNPYFFVTEQQFQQLIHEDLFAEWAIVHSHCYGTSKEQLQRIWDDGKYVIMDIDVQGAEILKKQYPQAHTIFILPPSLKELEKRLQTRDNGQTKNLKIRLENAKKEMEMARHYKYQVINDQFDTSYQQFQKILDGILKSQKRL